MATVPDIGRFGIWTYHFDLQPSSVAVDQVAEIEELGYGAVWFPEAIGREALTNAALLLRGGRRIVVATGVAQIWARDAMAMAGAQRTIDEAYPGRFLLGMGVSHQPAVESLRGHSYGRPYSAMVDYLDRMDRAMFAAVEGPEPPRRVLAALGPRMLGLAAERAHGALTYFVPPAHTAAARSRLGPGPLLAVEQAVVLETEPSAARELARTYTSIYTSLPNYTNNLRRYGFDDEDFDGAGSDRLVDAVVAWGDLDAIRARVRAHHDAGADHVAVQVVTRSRETPIAEFGELAAALGP